MQWSCTKNKIVYTDFLNMAEISEIKKILKEKGKIEVGEMSAYILYISMLINPIRTFVTLFEQVEEGLKVVFKHTGEIYDKGKR